MYEREPRHCAHARLTIRHIFGKATGSREGKKSFRNFPIPTPSNLPSSCEKNSIVGPELTNEETRTRTMFALI
jgi:hypothetical protein